MIEKNDSLQFETFIKRQKMSITFQNKQKNILSINSEKEKIIVESMKVIDDERVEVEIGIERGEVDVGSQRFIIGGKEIKTMTGEVVRGTEKNDLIGSMKSMLILANLNYFKEMRKRNETLEITEYKRGAFLPEYQKIRYALRKIEEIKKTYEQRAKMKTSLFDEMEEPFIYIEREELKEQNRVLEVTRANNELYQNVLFFKKNKINNAFFYQGKEKIHTYLLSEIIDRNNRSEQERFSNLLNLIIAITEMNMRFDTKSINEIEETEIIIESFDGTIMMGDAVRKILNDGNIWKIHEALKDYYADFESYLFFKPKKEVKEEYENKEKRSLTEKTNQEKTGKRTKKKKTKL